MFESNISATDVKNGGYTLSELKTSPYSINDIKAAGFTAGEMRGSILSIFSQFTVRNGSNVMSMSMSMSMSCNVVLYNTLK